MTTETTGCPECLRGDDRPHRRDCFIGLCYERDALKDRGEALAKALRTLMTATWRETGAAHENAQVALAAWEAGS